LGLNKDIQTAKIGMGFMNSKNGLFVETTFVLFFLSLDFGQNLFAISADGIFLGVTVVAIAVLPYYLPSANNQRFADWIKCRGAIVLPGIFLGTIFNGMVGSVLPEVLRFAPLALALFTGVAACIAMFGGVLRFKYAD